MMAKGASVLEPPQPLII